MAKRRTDDYYRELKKELNKVHNFSFKLPRKSKALSPQQKAAITRIDKKYREQLKALDKAKRDYPFNFIAYKKGERYPSLEGVRTNKGIFTHTATTPTTVRYRGKKVAMRRLANFYFIDINFPKFLTRDPIELGEWIEDTKQHYIKSLGKKFKFYGAFYARLDGNLRLGVNKINLELMFLYFEDGEEKSAEEKAKYKNSKTEIIGMNLVFKRK